MRTCCIDFGVARRDMAEAEPIRLTALASCAG